jgi:hypothetical protein
MYEKLQLHMIDHASEVREGNSGSVTLCGIVAAFLAKGTSKSVPIFATNFSILVAVTAIKSRLLHDMPRAAFSSTVTAPARYPSSLSLSGPREPFSRVRPSLKREQNTSLTNASSQKNVQSSGLSGHRFFSI